MKTKTGLILALMVVAIGGVVIWHQSKREPVSGLHTLEGRSAEREIAAEATRPDESVIVEESREAEPSLAAKEIADATLPSEPPAPAAASVSDATVSEQAGNVAGKVIGPEEEPVVGCEAIFLRQGFGSRAIPEFAKRGRYRESEPYAVTDASGEFLAEAIPVGRYVIAWRAPGYIYRAYDDPVEVRAGETTGGILQTLERAGVIEGQVVENLTGKPIAEAKLSAEVVSSNRHEGDILFVHKKLSTFSDEGGEFRLDCLLQGEQYNLLAQHDRYADAVEKEVAVDRGAPVQIVMSAGGSIEGWVVFDQDGAPAEKAQVVAVQEKISRKSVQSATGGAFLVEGLLAGDYRLYATKGRHRSDPLKEVKVGWSEKVGPVTLRLEPGPVITGVVRDSISNLPIAGALVITEDMNSQDETDEEGLYWLEGLQPERVRVIASAKGYVRADIFIQPVAGKETECDFVLEPGGDVDVLVTDKEQKPIEGAQIITLDKIPPQPRPEDKTNAEGRVRVEGVRLKNPPMMMAIKEGYGFAIPIAPQFPPGETLAELHFTLASEGKEVAFAGKVTDASGQPVSGATIAWMTQTNPAGDSTTSEADGSYELTATGAGIVARLSCHAEGFAPVSKTGLSPGTPDAPAVVDFQMLPAHWLEVTIVDPKDEPISNVRIAVLTAGWPPMPVPGLMGGARTDERGHCRLENLPGPQISLLVMAEGWTPIEQKTVEVDQEIRLKMMPLGVIRGRVLEKGSEEPVRSFTVSVSIPGMFGLFPQTRKEVFSSSDGRFEFPGLEQGKTCQLIVEAEGFAQVLKSGLSSKPLEEAKEQIIYLSREGQLLGIVVDGENQERLSDITVVYAAEYKDSVFFDWSDLSERNAALSGIQTIRSDSEGFFEFEESGEAQGTLFVSADGYENLVVRPEERRVTVGDLVELALRRGASLSGQYHDRGTPLGQETLLLIQIPIATAGNLLDDFLTDPGDLQMIGRTITDGEGMYRWEDLSAGRYQICNQILVSGMGIFRFGYRCEIARGEQKTVDLGDGLGPYSLFGQVLDGQGQPIPSGVIVTLEPRFSWNYCDFGAIADGDGRYSIEGLQEGRYRAMVLKVALNEPSLYTQMIEEVEITGDTEHNFVFGVNHAVTARLVFPEDITEASRANYASASLSAKSLDPNTPVSLSEIGKAFVQGDQITFRGRFKGEYEITMSDLIGSNQTPISNVFQLDNLDADQDLGDIVVP